MEETKQIASSKISISQQAEKPQKRSLFEEASDKENMKLARTKLICYYYRWKRHMAKFFQDYQNLSAEKRAPVRRNLQGYLRFSIRDEATQQEIRLWLNFFLEHLEVLDTMARKQKYLEGDHLKVQTERAKNIFTIQESWRQADELRMEKVRKAKHNSNNINRFYRESPGQYESSFNNAINMQKIKNKISKPKHLFLKMSNQHD